MFLFSAYLLRMRDERFTSRKETMQEVYNNGRGGMGGGGRQRPLT